MCECEKYVFHDAEGYEYGRSSCGGPLPCKLSATLTQIAQCITTKISGPCYCWSRCAHRVCCVIAHPRDNDMPTWCWAAHGSADVESCTMWNHAHVSSLLEGYGKEFWERLLRWCRYTPLQLISVGCTNEKARLANPLQRTCILSRSATKRGGRTHWQLRQRSPKYGRLPVGRIDLQHSWKGGAKAQRSQRIGRGPYGYAQAHQYHQQRRRKSHSCLKCLFGEPPDCRGPLCTTPCMSCHAMIM